MKRLTDIYHYHATVQMDPGAITNIDGIISANKRIDSMVRYGEIKASIVKNESIPHERLTICSLSLLHAIEDDG